MNNLHIRLKKLMIDANVKQKVLARDIGVSEQDVSIVATGKRKPSLKMLVSLAMYFGASTDYLLGLSDEKIPNMAYPKEITISGKRFVLTEKKESEE